MQRTRKISIGKAAAVVSAIPFLLYAYEYGPPGGVAGVPGENTCIQAGCHTGTANSGGGSVSVTFPSGMSYTPGTKQHLTVTVTDSAQKKFGFQLTARQSASSTTQAGTFTPGSDGFTQLVCGQDNSSVPPPSSCPSLEYIEHTKAAYDAAQSTFQFDWTPPSTAVGNIVIYVAGNAVNGDLTPNGDHVYTASYTLTPAAGGGSAPTITGVANGAGGQNTCQSGSWVSIFGSNLATNTRSWSDADFANGQAPTSLDGTSVTVDGKPAFVAFISPTQVNIQMPTDSNVGSAGVQVTTAAGTSNTATANLQTYSPAFFLWNGTYAVATRPDFCLVGKAGLFSGVTTTPAKPGDVIILWGTGFGPTNPSVPAGQKVSGSVTAQTNPTVTVGGAPAQVAGVALSPGFLGLYQVAITVPATVQTGADVPIVASLGGVNSPDGVMLTIAGP